MKRFGVVLMLLLACAALLIAGRPAAAQLLAYDPLAAARDKMVDEEIVAAGVKNPRVVAAMRNTPRHEFVQAMERPLAYYDMALPIGNSQTISPPYVVAYMTEQLDPQPDDKVLEIGTGSGYQAAVLSPLVRDVYTIEIVKPLGERAARTLKRLKYANVHTKIGDGYAGWAEFAPFDKIIVTCSPEKVPAALVAELKEGGRLIVPVGERYQQTLYMFKKEGGKLVSTALLPTLFVPMTGQAEAGREIKPDPANPRIANGSFEEIATNENGKKVIPGSQAVLPAKAAADDAPTPVGWHYQRQLELVESKESPEGQHYVRFANVEPGRASRALQGLAVDGRKVHELEFSLWVKAKDVQAGRDDEEVPVLGIVFYDENRGQVGRAWLGPWKGTFGWRHEKEVIAVPPLAREAVLRIGLHGGVGEISFDDIQVKPARNR
jgi:protein-L-isoaspartate(D-aspartate) O-methyltransferase